MEMFHAPAFEASPEKTPPRILEIYPSFSIGYVHTRNSGAWADGTAFAVKYFYLFFV
jgi:hypothetical protein